MHSLLITLVLLTDWTSSAMADTVADIVPGKDSSGAPKGGSTTTGPPFTLPYDVPPPVIDPQLCKQLQHVKTENVSETESYRREQLLHLCQKRAPPNTTSGPLVKLKKRSLVVNKLKKREQKILLELHNHYRRSVKPVAADMKLMKWDTYLADTAQMWADGCIFEHGMPDEVTKKQELLGQNLYVGNEPTGYRAMQMWFEEIDYYDYETTECEEGELCGHYLQVTWADTEYVGCGKSKCVQHGYYIACHYRPHGNVPDVQPFSAGKPCSQCRSKSDGGLCFNKTCVTSSECKSMDLTCSCNLECHNCAVLRPSYCRCVCKNGWDSLDCSRSCTDGHYYCGNDPGWPNMLSCGLEQSQVGEIYCRRMCKRCKPANATEHQHVTSKLCCNGTECENGYVLNEKNCECRLLCPGPACLSEVPSSPVPNKGTSGVPSSPVPNKGTSGVPSSPVPNKGTSGVPTPLPKERTSEDDQNRQSTNSLESLETSSDEDGTSKTKLNMTSTTISSTTSIPTQNTDDNKNSTSSYVSGESEKPKVMRKLQKNKATHLFEANLAKLNLLFLVARYL